MLILPRADQPLQLVALRQEMHPLKQLGGEMLNAFIPCVSNAKNDRAPPQALKLLDLAHAERLSERRKAFKNVGKVLHVSHIMAMRSTDAQVLGHIKTKVPGLPNFCKKGFAANVIICENLSYTDN